jgi:hypothetical protein
MTHATVTRDVVTGSHADVLDAIVHPETALAIWRRELPPALWEALAPLDLDEIDDIAVELAADTPLEDILRAAGYPDAAVAPIAADVVALARHHRALTGVDGLVLRLEVIETDACRRFHADYVTLRLLCTYVGAGTEWHHVDIPDAVERVPTGAVAVFKGRLMLDPPSVLHRSPPIMASGGRRLVLAIDPAKAADR